MNIDEVRQWIKERYPFSQDKKLIDELANIPSQVLIWFYSYLSFMENDEHRLKPLNNSKYCVEIDFKVNRAKEIIELLLRNGLISINLKKLRKSDCEYNNFKDELIDINLEDCSFNVNFYNNRHVTRSKLLEAIKDLNLSIDDKFSKYMLTEYYVNLMGVRCHLYQEDGPDYIGSDLLMDYPDITKRVFYLFSNFSWKETIGIIRLSAIDAQGYSKVKYKKQGTRIMALRIFRHNLKYYTKQVRIGKLNLKNFILPQDIENDFLYKSIKDLKDVRKMVK